MAKKSDNPQQTSEEHAKPETNKPHSGGIIIPKNIAMVVVIVFIVAIAFLVAGKSGGNSANSAGSQTSYDVPGSASSQCRQVSYQDTEAYQEQECQTVPYTDRECESKPLTYSKTNYQCGRAGWVNDWSTVECTINNLDAEGGTFKVNIGVVVKGTNVGESQSQFIYPQSAYTFKYSVQADSTACYCNEFEVPTKQVCRDVIKTRQDCQVVTKYRPVTKYREECN
ncbi:TPA: hypothetical protein HA244_05425 [Candidatus Micrarchaeota archaeon]|nr:hypothetical protein [Candidatus Micrarchaeota archaeon]